MNESLIKSICETIELNPTKNKTLPKLINDNDNDEAKEQTWDIFTMKPIFPSNPTAVYLENNNSLYSMGVETIKLQILRETILELQEKATLSVELQGRKYPKQRVQDLIAGQLSNSIKQEEKPMLEEILCKIYNYQKICINIKKKSITFHPSDPRLWKSGIPFIVSDDDNCWQFICDNSNSMSVVDWIVNKEDNGWSIKWTHADGKLVDMKEAIESRGLIVKSLSEERKKPIKEDYGRVLGRAECISYLQTYITWNTIHN